MLEAWSAGLSLVGNARLGVSHAVYVGREHGLFVQSCAWVLRVRCADLSLVGYARLGASCAGFVGLERVVMEVDFQCVILELVVLFLVSPISRFVGFHSS